MHFFYHNNDNNIIEQKQHSCVFFSILLKLIFNYNLILKATTNVIITERYLSIRTDDAEFSYSYFQEIAATQPDFFIFTHTYAI